MHVRFPSPTRQSVLLGAIALLILGAVIALWKGRPASHSPASQSQPAVSAQLPSSASQRALPPPPTTLPVATPPSAKTPDTFRRHPFPVARESANYQWTADDGKSPDVIRKLAHNEMEEKRMLAENPRIKRRQLVYIKQPVSALMEQSKLTGEKLKSLVLPGLDGQELQFEITGADLAPSGQIGTFTGHLAGRPQSSVSLAYRFGRQAFTVLSPEDGNNFDAEPREPGEVIVKSIDPATYQPLRGGEAILTKPTAAKGH
jgi:hypothetical protein